MPKFKNEEFTFVELGAYEGASIKMWESYFKRARIIGVGIDVSCRVYEGQKRKFIFVICLRNLN